MCLLIGSQENVSFVGSFCDRKDASWDEELLLVSEAGSFAGIVDPLQQPEEDEDEGEDTIDDTKQVICRFSRTNGQCSGSFQTVDAFRLIKHLDLRATGDR